jgi:transcriptional regulator with XRE-family HTH domain
MIYVLARSSRGPYPLEPVRLGKNIERLRLAAGKTNAAAFAREMGVPAQKLKDWESGRYTKLRLDSLLLLAKALGCAVDELLDGVDPAYDKIVIARRDLLGQSIDPASDLSKPGRASDVTASANARIQQFKKERDDARAALREMRGIASRLVEIAAAAAHEDVVGAEVPTGTEGGLPGGNKSGVRKGRRGPN